MKTLSIELSAAAYAELESELVRMNPGFQPNGHITLPAKTDIHIIQSYEASISSIVTMVCAKFLHLEVTPLDVFGDRRTAAICLCRHTAITIAKRFKMMSQTRVGKVFKLDHGTISNAIKNVQNRIDTEPDFARQYGELLAELKKT
jgi:chromosomal replication initiation ATPase DnaA